MKISVVADCHLNRILYKGVMDNEFENISFRTADYLRAFRYIVNDSIENVKPELFVIVGDIYDNFSPANDVRSFFNDQLRLLKEAKIPVIMLVGNHDICRKHHALQPLKSLGIKSLKVIEEPTTIEFKGHTLLLFPHSLEVEKNNLSMREEFLKFVEEARPKIKDPSKTIFFGHFGVKSGTLKVYEHDGKKKTFKNTSSSSINLDDLDSIGASYVFLGDYHHHHILETKRCRAMYTGSIERSDTSEKDDKKGYIVYDDSKEEQGKLGFCEFRPYPNCRPIVELKGTVEDIKKQINKLDGSSKTGIFKIIFEGNNNQLVDFSVAYPEIKETLYNEFEAVYIFDEQNVKNEKQEEEAQEIRIEIEEKGQIDESDVLKIIHGMIDEEGLEEEETKTLKEEAKQIFKEALE